MLVTTARRVLQNVQVTHENNIRTKYIYTHIYACACTKGARLQCWIFIFLALTANYFHSFIAILEEITQN